LRKDGEQAKPRDLVYIADMEREQLFSHGSQPTASHFTTMNQLLFNDPMAKKGKDALNIEAVYKGLFERNSFIIIQNFSTITLY